MTENQNIIIKGMKSDEMGIMTADLFNSIIKEFDIPIEEVKDGDSGMAVWNSIIFLLEHKACLEEINYLLKNG